MLINRKYSQHSQHMLQTCGLYQFIYRLADLQIWTQRNPKRAISDFLYSSIAVNCLWVCHCPPPSPPVIFLLLIEPQISLCKLFVPVNSKHMLRLLLMILVNADTVWMIITITVENYIYQIVHNSYPLFIIKQLLLTLSVSLW